MESNPKEMVKKIMNIEVDTRIPGIEMLHDRLELLITQAADSYDFEDILNNAVQSLYREQIEGQVNYGRKNPRVGKVWLCRSNNEQPGKANIEYSPAGEYKEKWKYTQKTIGSIDLRGRTFSVDWKIGEYNKNYHQIPEVLMKDTEKVMECLGLSDLKKVLSPHE
jgi:hypothetical protein